MKVNLEFHECEHQGDMDNYINDLLDCGATQINSNINYEAEIGTVDFEVKDYGVFLSSFEKVEAYEFSSLCN